MEDKTVKVNNKVTFFKSLYNDMKEIKSFDTINQAKRITLYHLVGLGIVVLIGIISLISQVWIKKDIEQRLQERDVLILTSNGPIQGKMSAQIEPLITEFSQVAVVNMLNYDPVNPTNALRFVKIYGTQNVFNAYYGMIRENDNSAYLEQKLYFASIDPKKISLETIEKNQKYKITMIGQRKKISNLSSTEMPFQFSLLIERDPYNGGADNIFGLRITSYKLEFIGQEKTLEEQKKKNEEQTKNVNQQINTNVVPTDSKGNPIVNFKQY